MKQILVVGEDSLTCALGGSLVAELLPTWQMPQPPIDKKGVTKLIPELHRYIRQAREFRPVLCIADTDAQCVRELLDQWLPKQVPENFLLRLAVPEAESWLLADNEALANYLEISPARIPRTPDEIADPKRNLLNLARRSKNRVIRQEVVSQLNPEKQGNGYNQHLCHFVRTHWSAQRAANNSPSLKRSIMRITRLGNAVN